MNESLRQLGGVEGLEHVLVLDVLEQHHLEMHPFQSSNSRKDGKSTYQAIESTLQVDLLGHLVVLPQQKISMLGKQLRRLSGRVSCGRITVDELPASLVQASHESCLSAEAPRDGLRVLAMNLEKRVNVSLGIDALGVITLADQLGDSGQPSVLDVLLKLLSERLQAFGNTGEQRVHPLQIFVFVEVQETLEAVPHEVRVLANKDVFAFADESFAGARVEVTVDAIFLLLQALLGFLEVFRHAVGSEEGFRLLLVVLLGGFQKWCFEELLVDIQALNKVSKGW